MRSVVLFLSVSALALVTSLTAFATEVPQRKLGNVIAVERRFKLDLGACGKSYTIRGSTSDNYRYGRCDVTVLPQDRTESLVSGTDITVPQVDHLGRKFDIELVVNKPGAYSVFVNTSEGADVSFISVRDSIQGLFKVPQQEATAIVYIVDSTTAAELPSAAGQSESD